MAKAWSTGIQHHPVRKAFQCKDIPDEMFIEAVRKTNGGTYGYEDRAWRMRWDVEETFKRLFGGETPPGFAKVMMAKFYKLEKRGILGGCSCGCRGDYHIETGDCC